MNKLCQSCTHQRVQKGKTNPDCGIAIYETGKHTSVKKGNSCIHDGFLKSHFSPSQEVLYTAIEKFIDNRKKKDK